jgi:predicted nicotinamide N-methyase
MSHLSNIASNLQQEINDDLMECWTELVAQPKQSAVQQAQQLSFIKYTAPAETETETETGSITQDANIERSVITSESRGLILSAGTTGFRTWEAALHLGSFLASEAGEAIVRNKRVIELGAGTGFLSLVCARYLGVRSVVVTDREPALIDNMRECVPHNLDSGQSIPIYPAVWEWGTPLERTGDLAGLASDEDEGEGIKFDVALGADLVSLSLRL